MKLNLLPTYVSKEKAGRNALLLSIVLFLVCVGGAFVMITKSEADFKASQEGLADLRQKATKAKETGDYADTVMQQSTMLLRNTQLAESMLAQSKKYPNLYDSVIRYIPSFYRINTMTATPLGPGQSRIDITGTIDSYQRYADLMLALLRMRGPNGGQVLGITREGFVNNDMYVPALTPEDQSGRPRRPGESPIPDDPLARMQYMRGKATSQGFTGEGNFGTGTTASRGAMPGSSLVTVHITIAEDLQTPDPRATLKANGSGGGSGQGGPNAAGNQTPNRNTSAPAPAGGNRATAGDDAEDR